MVIASGPTSVTADTWGIPGPAFLGLYLVGVPVVAGLVLLIGRAAEARPVGATRTGRPYPTGVPGPVGLGLLAGGPTLAVTVALAELRGTGLLDPGGRPLSPASGDAAPVLTTPVSLLDPVTSASHAVVAERLRLQPEARITPRTLLNHPRLLTALDAERDRLADARLLTRRLSPAGVALTVVPAVAFCGLGVLRVLAGLNHDRPVGLLVVLVVAAGLALSAVVTRTVPAHRTAGGVALLRELRHANLHLAPRLQPSWTTYGPASVVLATALFGAVALQSADPDFAEAAELTAGVHRDRSASFGGGGDGGGDGGGCGSSGCGSSSSCGGGCGGGGCGG